MKKSRFLDFQVIRVWIVSFKETKFAFHWHTHLRGNAHDCRFCVSCGGNVIIRRGFLCFWVTLEMAFQNISEIDKTQGITFKKFK